MLFPVDSSNILGIVEAFAGAVDGKTVYTAGHSLRVAEYSVLVGEELDLTEKEISMLRFAALLHDIGKINVPRDILNKAGELTPEEWEVIKAHPRTGAEIVARVEFFKELAPAIYYHHEYFNGRGYPGELAGADIPVEARIIAVTDAYEAMTSVRPYRKGFSHRDALARLKEGGGWQFDVDIVECFIKSIRRRKDSMRT
ncbi:MAG: HD-GYP domain-containing protein [Firmicutes bacterium]|nr:HD-GYP domain-containing protein [Bacillota bacterium]